MIYKDTTNHKGRDIVCDAINVDGNVFLISCGFIRTAQLKYVYHSDVKNPEKVIAALKTASKRVDFLRFCQRVPDTHPKFDYYRETREIAAIPISTFDYWWTQQINAKTRNMVRKPEKNGVRIEETDLTESFINGVVEIFNESPLKRGKPFWHYGKDYKTVEKGLNKNRHEAIYIASYFKDELIGYIKLIVADRNAMITQILDKMSQRDKSPMNGLIAKAVEICADRGIPFITYTVWRRGDHGKFQERNGFRKYPVPEYFVPLTLRGKISLKLGLHNGVKPMVPEKVYELMLSVRAKIWALKFKKKLEEGRPGVEKHLVAPRFSVPASKK